MTILLADIVSDDLNNFLSWLLISGGIMVLISIAGIAIAHAFSHEDHTALIGRLMKGVWCGGILIGVRTAAHLWLGI